MKAVVFDMDGVIVDSEPANLKQLADFMKTYGVVPDDAFLHSLVGSSISYTAIQCTKVMKQTWSEQEFNTQLDAYALAHPVVYKSIIREGIKETLLQLHKNGFRTAIASSAPLMNIQRMLQECDLVEAFDIVLSGEMFAESKPNPEIYLKAAEKLGCLPEECIAVEDSHFGIEAGLRAGMRTIAFEDQRFGTDQSKANEKINNIKELLDLLHLTQ